MEDTTDWPHAPSTPASRSQPRTQPATDSSQSPHLVSPGATPSTPIQSHRSRHGAKLVIPSSGLGPRHSNDHAESPKPPQTPVSSFLLEKLRQERLAESEKQQQASSRTPVDINAALESGGVPASPVRPASPAEGRRPRSSESSGDPQAGKKKGLGLKEMEQIMSKMHKQNFDLKLELFHRRQKQATLESKLEQTIADKDQLEAQNRDLLAENARQGQQNELLLQEVDKRDKAVQEAVSMIVTLESEKDALTKQLNILRELTGTFFRAELDSSLASNTPRNLTPLQTTATAAHGHYVVSKMPSFVSQASQRTENLRDVWMSVHVGDNHNNNDDDIPPLPSVRAASGISRIETEPMAVVSSETEQAPVTRLSSPCLSDLSESSFQSIYGGRREDDYGTDQSALENNVGTHGDQGRRFLDGSPSLAQNRYAFETTPGACIVSPTRVAKEQPQSSGKPWSSQHEPPPPPARSQFTSITDIIGHEPPHPDSASTFEPVDSGYNDATPRYHQPASLASPSSRSDGVRDKRDVSRRGAMNEQQALPPTPDTISTSTLGGRKRSDDDEARILAPMRAQTHERGKMPEGGVSLSSVPPRLANTTPLVAELQGGSTLFGRPLPPRPRSASETTVSRIESDWESGDDDVSDAHSLESSLDIWLRESSKSAERHASSSQGHYGSTVVQSQSRKPPSLGLGPALRMEQQPVPVDRRATRSALPERMSHRSASLSRPPTVDAPNLFASGGAWDSAGAMVGGDAIQAALSATVGSVPPPAPPPPGRRSSLAAKTGSKAASPLNMPRPASTQPQRSSSRHIDFGMPSTVRQAPQPPVIYEPKKQYPPVSGPARGRLNLFRRSTTGAPASSSETVPASPQLRSPSPGGQWNSRDAPAASAPTKTTTTAPGTSLWGRRGSIGNDESATPPPILRQRGPSLSAGSHMPDGEGVSLAGSGNGSGNDSGSSNASTISVGYRVPETPKTHSPLQISVAARGVGLSPPMSSPIQASLGAQPAQPPAKKKWLPFGRSNSLRNRAS